MAGRRLGVLCLVLFLCVGIYYYFSSQAEPLSDSEYQFKVENTDAIQKVKVTHPSGAQVVLLRQEDHWQLASGRRVRENAIVNLMRAVKNVELQFIPGQAARPGMLDDLRRQGVMVEIFGENQEELMAYQVGGATPDERGTYMMRKGSSTPVVTTMPGWEGSLRIRFWMPELDWFDRSIFRTDLEDIERVQMLYHDVPSASFVLQRAGDDFVCAPLGASRAEAFRVQKAAMERYLIGFQSVGAEAVLSQSDFDGAMSDYPPYATIELDLKGKKYAYVIYRLPLEETARVSIQRYYFINQDGDIYLVQDALVKEIFLAHAFFSDYRVEASK